MWLGTELIYIRVIGSGIRPVRRSKTKIGSSSFFFKEFLFVAKVAIISDNV
jgi:hypothetical protein